MAHLGLYLGASPHAGGMFQYGLSVIRGIAPLLEAGWTITAFAHDDSWRADLPAGFRLVVRPKGSPGAWAALACGRVVTSLPAARLFGRMDPMVRAIDAAGCDLVVCPGQDAVGYQLRSRTLVTVHDLMHRYEPQFEEYQGGEYQGRDRYYRRLCHSAMGILTDSKLGRRQVVESYGIAPGKVFVLPYAAPEYLLELKDCDLRSKYGLCDRYFFYPAQFWEHKNHLRLLEAVAILKRQALAPKLVLAGSRKNAFARVVARITELGLSDDVKILGYVPNEDMAALYRGAVATVFVSLIGPTNIPPLEAMLLGSPLVVSNIYAMPEQVGDAAILVDPRNPDDIAAAMARAWTDGPTRRMLIDRGRERSARWTGAHFGARLREIVGDLVAAPGQGASRGAAAGA